MTGSAIVGRPEPDRLAYWQTMDSGRLLLLSAAAMLVVTAFTSSWIEHRIQWSTALAFGGFIALGELLRLALPGGREAAPIAMVGTFSYALLLRVPVIGMTHVARSEQYHLYVKGVATQSPQVVIAVSAVGMALGALPHIAAGRPAGAVGIATRLVAVSCVAFSFRPLAGMLVRQSWVLTLGVIVLLVTFGWLVDALVGALIRADDVGARFSVAMVDELRLQWPLGLAIGASVVITVFGAEVMGLTELAVFLGPLLVTQVAFRRYAGIRATYLQTVRSLARVTEVAGYVEEGHSGRVSRLAVGVGRSLGMPEPELLALEYAALMHDIGQLSLRDPIPGGATVLVSAADQQRIAGLGADVIRQAGVLDDVAELVRCQNWPAHGPNPEPPLGSMIIRAANAFDDMVGSSTDRERSAAAVDRMRRDPVQYDSVVVAALAGVASRRLPPRR